MASGLDFNIECCDVWDSVMSYTFENSGATFQACDPGNCKTHPLVRKVMAFIAQNLCNTVYHVTEQGSKFQCSLTETQPILQSVKNVSAMAFYATLLPIRLQGSGDKPLLDQVYAEYDSGSGQVMLKDPIAGFSREVYEAVVVCMAVLLVVNVAVSGMRKSKAETGAEDDAAASENTGSETKASMKQNANTIRVNIDPGQFRHREPWVRERAALGQAAWPMGVTGK